MEKFGLLFETVFKRKLTDEDAVSYLEKITKEHPYFSVAQFYLLRLSQRDISDIKLQAKKTAILFNNNHWLNFQLLEAGFNKNGTTVPSPPSFPEKIAEEITNADKYERANQQITEEVYTTDNRIEAAIEEEIKTEVVEEKHIEEDIKEEESGVTEPVVINEPIIAGDSNTIDEAIVDETDTTTEEIEQTDVNISETIESVISGDNVNVNEEISPVPIEEIEKEMEPSIAEQVNETVQAEETTSSTIADEKSDIAQEEEAINIVQDKPLTVEEIKAEPLLFEPLHTTDYFASVGIKLSEEEKTAGSLGKQLKSFTEWLKTMKKVHTEQLAKPSGRSEVNLSVVESSIQKMAEKSNQENDVVTEAMADVLEQQGKADKAIEILEKLSLLNPGKSVYFAAKINQIKDK
jgi:hypothetical protein